LRFRSSAVMLSARAFPPFRPPLRPRAMAFPRSSGVGSRSSTWPVRISTISLASWFVSRGRFWCLDISRRWLLTRLVILGDAANDTGEAGIYICNIAVLPLASRIQAGCTITTSFPFATERVLANSARHPLAGFDKVFVCHGDNRTTAAKQIPRRQPGRISD